MLCVFIESVCKSGMGHNNQKVILGNETVFRTSPFYLTIISCMSTTNYNENLRIGTVCHNCTYMFTLQQMFLRRSVGNKII